MRQNLWIGVILPSIDDGDQMSMTGQPTVFLYSHGNVDYWGKGRLP